MRSVSDAQSSEEGAMMPAEAQKATRLQTSLADFELLRRIGDGSYSHVVLARHRATGREYALKVVDKQYILRHKVVEYIRKERQILDTLEYEGIAQLFFTFQDVYSLYLGLEYCPNGELYDQIRLRGRLDEAAACFYAAQVVLMLEHLRVHRVVHRDLKPENLLLDAAGHLKLIDFGSAKLLPPEEVVPEGAAAAAAVRKKAAEAAAAGEGEAGGEAEEAGDVGAALTPSSSGSAGAEADGEAEQGDAESGGDGSAGAAGAAAAGVDEGEEEAGEVQGEEAEEEEGEEGEACTSPNGGASKRQVSLVGTADYVSPEILNNRPVSCAADLWALGCVLYQMLVGRPPFKSPSEYLTFQKIVEGEYEMPEGLPPSAADLITRLLALEPAERIGAADLAELRAHPFFEGVAWESLRSQEPPEFVPDPADADLSSAGSSFDWELQSLASALPPGRAEDHLEIE